MTRIRFTYIPCVFGLLLLAVGFALAQPSLFAQSTTTAVAELPDAPAAASQQNPGQQAAQPAQQQSTSSSSSSSSSSSGTQTSTKTKQQQDQEAAEQLKQEEKQRILGVVPNFNTTNDKNAAPLTTKQKFQLDLHSSLDPFVFVFAGLDAAEEQAEDSFPEYGQGAKGYAKRFGASYADTFDGNLWGNAILPSMLHEDPRYFRMGTGTFMHRALYSAWTTVWCKRDNGTWGPNYANVAGNFIAGGISNLYYPVSDRGATLTVERALTVTAEGAIGSEFVEFWPDISQWLFHKKNKVPPAQPAPVTSPAPNGSSDNPQ